jgi:hypothetical protein
MIRTTNDIVRTLLLQASLLAHFLVESLHTSTYLLNHLPSAACPAPTPHHTLFGTPLRYDHLRVFGCACYPNTTATAPHKLAPRSTLCVFLGYSPDHKGYRYYDLTSRRVLISRHVVLDESVFPFSTTTTPSTSGLDLSSLPTDAVVEPPLPFFLQVRRPRALARHRLVPPSTLLLVRSWTGTLPGRPLSFRLTGVPARHLRLRLHASPGRSSCTSAEPSLRRHLCRRRWPLLRQRLPLRQEHRGRRRSPKLLASSPRCITRRSFTATRVMFILW